MHEHWAKILKSSVCRMCIYDILLHGAMEWGRDVYLAPTCLILNGVYSSLRWEKSLDLNQRPSGYEPAQGFTRTT